MWLPEKAKVPKSPFRRRGNSRESLLRRYSADIQRVLHVKRLKIQESETFIATEIILAQNTTGEASNHPLWVI